MRNIFIAGNWKMNLMVPEAVELLDQLYQLLSKDIEVEVAVCPSFVCLPAACDFVREQQRNGYLLTIKVGAQNAHWEESGAFTGEVSAPMLKSIGCTYVILGHSERRTIFSESDEYINQKMLAVLKNGLLPILCVGETLEERESEQTYQVIEKQLRGALASISPSQMEACTIAYEPVWAIGTGKTATPETAQQAHAFIRKFLEKNYGSLIAQEVRILYGGSVKPKNVSELITQQDIDGALVGGASLQADSFSEIINLCRQAL